MSTSFRQPFSPTPLQVLSIAGSDPSGGAGIQGDLKTFASLGAYGMSVITALTAQNTCGVRSIHIPPVDFFHSQLQSIWDDIEIDAIKIGMLANNEIILALKEQLNERANSKKIVPIVLDPVMVSTSGSLLLTHESIQDLIKHLLPLCTLLTPNLPEARQLLSHARNSHTREIDIELSTVEALLRAARELCRLGPQSVLVKGGHQVMTKEAVEQDLTRLGLIIHKESRQEELVLGAKVIQATWEDNKVTIIRTDDDPYADILQYPSAQMRNVVLDVLYEIATNQYTLFIKSHIESTATHGTGCTLSSALAVHLGSGLPLMQSTYEAIHYVQDCLSRGLLKLGKGSGPLNHICHTMQRPILTPAATGPEQNPLSCRLIAHSLPLWKNFTRHSFLHQLGNQTLSSESFIYFLKQDYLFLKNYARVWASGASSFTIGNTFARIAMFASVAAEMAAEADHHVKICEPWGITKNDLESTAESAATLAYTRFVLDVSRSGDALEFLAATGPCLYGYGEAGVWLNSNRKKSTSPATSSSSTSSVKGYEQWIDYYSGQDFQRVVQQGIKSMEEFANNDPPSITRVASLQRIWNAAVRLEIGMWDEALDTSIRRDILDA